jgi:hypothetical protein
MTDAKSVQEMREIMDRVQARAERDHVGIYEAARREGVAKTTYYSYKQRLEGIDKVTEIAEEKPIVPAGPMEAVIIPEKKKHPVGKKRISIDLPDEVFDYIEKEHNTSTLSVKAMCQKIIIDYVKPKMLNNEKLF